MLPANTKILFHDCVETRSYFVFNCISRNKGCPNQLNSHGTAALVDFNCLKVEVMKVLNLCQVIVSENKVKT